MVSCYAMAEERTEEWYKTVDGNFAVMDSNHQNTFATIAWSKSGDARVYIQAYQPEHCEQNGDQILIHDPLYINNPCQILTAVQR